MIAFLGGVAVLTATFAAIATLERVPVLQYRRQRLCRRWFRTDLAWYLTSAVVAGVFAFTFRPVLERLALPGTAELVRQVPDVVVILVGLVVFDFVAFGVHVLLHRSDTLWAFHKVHHSSVELDVFSTTRTQPFELLIRNVPAQLALFALGVPGALVGTVLLLFAAFGALNHSNLRLPLQSVEWLLITPRLHRSHHVPATSMCNFGTVFSLWDRAAYRLFRGDVESSARLGVPGEIDSFPQSFPQAVREPFRELHRRAAPAEAPEASEPVAESV
jgi:sterol desaturase/sphingolipid hydroxylase (fatty acid hydroxylase superfamily)